MNEQFPSASSSGDQLQWTLPRWTSGKTFPHLQCKFTINGHLPRCSCSSRFSWFCPWAWSHSISSTHKHWFEQCIRNWRDGSVVASCSSRGPGSNSQYPQNESQVSVTPVTWDSLPSFSLLGHCAHVAHRHTHADITPTHITYNKFCKRSREEAKEWS